MTIIDSWLHRWFGIWKERGARYNGFPSIYSFIDESVNDAYDKPRLLEYLRSGKVVAVTSRRGFPCVFTGKVFPGSIAYRTDGVWLWLDDMGYYIENFGLCLPISMLKNIENNGFHVPLVTSRQVELLEWPKPSVYD